MTEKLNLRQKLAKIRESIEYLQKDMAGNQGAKYVNPAVLLKKIRVSMNEVGIVLSTSVVSAEMSLISQPEKANKDKHNHLCCMSMNMVWMDTDSNEQISVPWFATGSHRDDPSMAMGGALTYTERYFFLKYFHIPTDKDDPENFKNKTKELPPPEKISDKQLSTVLDLINAKFPDPTDFNNWLLKELKITGMEEMMTDQYDKALFEIGRA